MKKIGLVGGISWTSTLDYYKYINQGINEKLGGLNSAECIIYSLNFSDIQDIGWTNSYDLIFNACKSLTSNNIDFIVLCANTAHLFADEIQSKINIPIIHIASATAEEIKKQKLHKVGLLGTKFTMEMDFYRNKLKEYNIETIVPSKKEDIEEIQEIVKNELGKGIINKESKLKFIQYANELIERGAEGLILGCTEIPMLIDQKDFDFPVFDTTKIHVENIVNFTLNQ
ncbi:aspartate/glutamate racemase family protein [Galbibacter pacificus]|uniref:Aspartate/glutamate racemase family protein n=1 Tax=Galbibacter pacificus TaxID=2996052 RepID=A0ABT6FMN1_9FLAO|nr:aspartate/glutamate racemase family protein [Galbibacter pacificus]MDG3581007.1 aspartate/glutamate racemase family protein [Galbibacter pacificus]MDG3584485.1 aspartate/glutamate racemase family protein [Galbibacter pacificus]